MRDIVVIGGGISGLVAAWQLKKAGRDVCLVEAEDQVGGCMRTERREGFLLEKGPFNIIARASAFHQLLDDFDDQVRIVPASKESKSLRYVLRGERLIEVPSGPLSLMTTPLFSFRAKRRLIRGLFSSPPATEKEETIDQVATRRFGPEVAQFVVDPLISGIFAGDSRELSFKACFPSIAEVDRNVGKPLRFMRRRAKEARKDGSDDHPRERGLISFQDGLETLPRAIGRRLGRRVRTSWPVEAIEVVDRGYVVWGPENAEGPASIPARQVLIATPGTVAALLLQPLLPEAAKVIESIDTESLVVLNLGFRGTAAAKPIEGYGFLVPRREKGFPLMGVLFASSVFPHHAPEDDILLRVFIGGPRMPDAHAMGDRDLVDMAMRAMRHKLRLFGKPAMVDVCRHPHSIPQYKVGHVEKIERLDRLVAGRRGLHVVGNYLSGVSINDCIRQGFRAAERMLSETGHAPADTEDLEPPPSSETEPQEVSRS